MMAILPQKKICAKTLKSAFVPLQLKGKDPNYRASNCYKKVVEGIGFVLWLTDLILLPVIYLIPCFYKESLGKRGNQTETSKPLNQSIYSIRNS